MISISTPRTKGESLSPLISPSLHSVRLPATRLAWAASNLVYGNTDHPLQGPQVDRVDEESPGGRDVVTGINVTFSSQIREPALEDDRFMVCCMESMDLCDERNYGQEQGWQGVKMVDWFTDGNYPHLEHLHTHILRRSDDGCSRPERGLFGVRSLLRSGLSVERSPLLWGGGLSSLL